jgi:hypothetical protein
MNSDALDDLARQLAATPASRRATLKAMAATIATGSLFGIHHRASKRGPPAAPTVANTSTVCNWDAGSAACLAFLAALAKCTEAKTLPAIAACAISLPLLAKKCHDDLNCHCVTGVMCSALLQDDTPICCEPPNVCDNVSCGCLPPCGPCQERSQATCWCDDICASSNPCCNGTCCGPAPVQCCSNNCVNTDTDINNCGGCGIGCPPGDYCANGQCQTCCVPGQICGSLPCCPGSGGACGQTCCDSVSQCCAGLGCIPASYTCCTGNEGQKFGCEFGCCGDGCLPQGNQCCDAATSSNCPAGHCCPPGTGGCC